MAKIPYRPYQVSRTERLAYRFKKEPVRPLDLLAKRRFRNPALMAHELPLRYCQLKTVGVRQSVPQYANGERILVVTEV